MRQLRPPSLLEQLGLSGAQRVAVLGSLVSRMAAPASERAAWHWLRQRSALGELLGCDCETMGRNALQRASDRLLRHRDTIETRLLQRAADLFDLQPTVTLHDRTSTCFEGPAAAGPPRPFQGEAPRLSAAHAGPGAGRQRLRAPLQGPGRQRRRGRHAAGHADGPGRAARGGRRARQRARHGGERRDAPALRVRAAGGAGAGDGGAGRRTPRDGPADAARGPVAQGHDQAVEKVWQRIGRLQARHPSAAPHCAIDVQADDRGRNATAVAWKRQPLEGSGATHPGVHGLRASSVGWDAGRLWRTCVTRTDLEAVLRSLGSALGPRPIHHRRPARSAGHLCLSVLACQLVPVVQQRLRAGGETARWTTLRRRLADQRRVTAVFRQADGRMLPTRARRRRPSPGSGRSTSGWAWTPRRAGSAGWSSSPDDEGKMHAMQCQTPDSAAAMCSLQTTHAMGWQTGAGGLDCGCAIAGKKCLESLA